MNTGAHGQREGLGAHWEIWMLVQGGMTPLEALRCATLNGAHYLGMDRDIGSLETGQARRLDRDGQATRSTTSAYSESIRYTIANGRVFDAMTMERVRQSSARAPTVLLRVAGKAEAVGSSDDCGE